MKKILSIAIFLAAIITMAAQSQNGGQNSGPIGLEARQKLPILILIGCTNVEDLQLNGNNLISTSSTTSSLISKDEAVMIANEVPGNKLTRSSMYPENVMDILPAQYSNIIIAMGLSQRHL